MAGAFDEVYPVKDGYKRFHQMNTAFGRAMRARKGSYGDPDRKVAKMKEGLPGVNVCPKTIGSSKYIPKIKGLFCSSFLLERGGIILKVPLSVAPKVDYHFN